MVYHKIDNCRNERKDKGGIVLKRNDLEHGKLGKEYNLDDEKLCDVAVGDKNLFDEIRGRIENLIGRDEDFSMMLPGSPINPDDFKPGDWMCGNECCQQKRKDKCIKDIRKNASSVEEVEKELKEEKIEAISGGLRDLEGLLMGELIGEPIKKNVKGQTELTESMLDFMNHSKFPH